MRVFRSITQVGILSTLVVIAILAGSPSAQATATPLINITPSATQLTIDPGTSKKGTASVINQGKAAFTVTLSSAPYHVAGLHYDPKFTPIPGAIDASSWIHFVGETTRSVPALRLSALDYTVDVPAGTPPGGYYAVIFAQTGASGEGTVSAQYRVGDILYITVKGFVEAAGTVSAPAIGPIITHTPLDLSVIVGNKGGAHFSTTVVVSVKNLFNKTVFTTSTERYILPQTQREISSTWSTNSALGIYRIDRSATLPSGTQQRRSQWVIIIQPWVLVTFFGASIATSTMLIVRLQRKRRHRS